MVGRRHQHVLGVDPALSDLLVGRAFVQPARVLVVGECPSPRWAGDTRMLLASPPFRRIAQLIYVDDHDSSWKRYLTEADRMNVLQRVTSARWNADATTEAATWGRQILQLAEKRTVYAVGRRAAVALGAGDAEWGDRVGSVVALPHPSGRNRWWNDSDAHADLYERARAVVKNRYP